MEVTMRALKGQALAIFSQCSKEEIEVMIAAKGELDTLKSALASDPKLPEKLGHAVGEVKMAYDVCKDCYTFAGDFTSIATLVNIVATAVRLISEDP